MEMIFSELLEKRTWCNGYRLKWTQWPDFKYSARLFALYRAQIHMGKVTSREMDYLILFWWLVSEKEISEFKLVKLPLKIILRPILFVQNDWLYAPLPSVEHSGEGINVCHPCMQSSSNELSIPLSDNAKCKQTKVNTKCIIISKLA